MNIYKSVVFCLLLAFPFATSYSQAAEAAIKEVLQAEMNFAVEHSVAEVAQKFWILDAKTVLHLSTSAGVVRTLNKEALLSMTEAPLHPKAASTLTNQKVYVNGNTAVASQDKVTILEDGSKLTAVEIKYLEKVEGGWKLHAASVQEF